MAEQKRRGLKRAGWFIGLWFAGVAAITTIGLLIKFALPSG